MILINILALLVKKMSIAPIDEDIVSMSANAAKLLLNGTDKNDIAFLLATETGVDESKSAGMFVHKLLELPNDCRVLELKQACYSGTAGLILAMSFIKPQP